MTEFVTASDLSYLKESLALAEGGRYSTGSNPCVGCVLVKEGLVVGRGWHEYMGGPHAEVRALLAAGEQAKGATAYVSLEPCAHQGRTGPCVQAFIEAGITRVVAAITDPNPQVAGSGFAALSAANIEVVKDVLITEARALNPGYHRRFETGRPRVRLKLAASLDGRTATASGESQWLTSAAARADVQHWRALSTAILTGSGTVLADDPALTVRDEKLLAAYPPEVDEDARQPWRLVLDRRGRLSESAKIFNQPGKVWWLTQAQKQAPENIQVCTGHWQPDTVLTLLAELGCNELLIEAGAELGGAFMAAGLVDELILYLAPSLIGPDARPLLALPALQHLADKIRLTIDDVCQLGPDIRVLARPR